MQFVTYKCQIHHGKCFKLRKYLQLSKCIESLLKTDCPLMSLVIWRFMKPERYMHAYKLAFHRAI